MSENVEVVRAAIEAFSRHEFSALEAAGGMSERGVVLAADPGHAQFFREMCRGFAALGRLQVASLRAAEETVATQVNLIAGDRVAQRGDEVAAFAQPVGGGLVRRGGGAGVLVAQPRAEQLGEQGMHGVRLTARIERLDERVPAM